MLGRGWQHLKECIMGPWRGQVHLCWCIAVVVTSPSKGGREKGEGRASSTVVNQQLQLGEPNKRHTGITEPVRAGVEAGVVLGLGKQEQDDFYTTAENVTRKRLETEMQAVEDDARRERREVWPCLPAP